MAPRAAGRFYWRWRRGPSRENEASIHQLAALSWVALEWSDWLLPENILTNAAQFDVIAKLIRAREPAMSAAKRELVDGISQAEAAREFGLFPQSVNQTVRRFNDANDLIQTAYSAKRNAA